MCHSKITDQQNFVELDITNNINEQYVVEAKSNSSARPATKIEFGSSIELRKPNGTTLTIHDLPRDAVQALVSTFMN